MNTYRNCFIVTGLIAIALAVCTGYLASENREARAKLEAMSKWQAELTEMHETLVKEYRETLETLDTVTKALKEERASR